MLINNIKADLSEAAQKKLETAIETAVEKKIRREAKKITRKLTVKFIVTGVILAGVCVIAGNSDKIVNYLKKSK